LTEKIKGFRAVEIQYVPTVGSIGGIAVTYVQRLIENHWDGHNDNASNVEMIINTVERGGKLYEVGETRSA
jgi:hypothetical protein